MKFKAFIFIALVLVCSVFTEGRSLQETKEVAQNEVKGDEPKHPNTFFCKTCGGMMGGEAGGGVAPAGGGVAPASGGVAPASGGGAPAGGGSYSGGISKGGVYGGGQICKFGCCSESHGYSHPGGGYFSCSCCATAAEAEAYKETQAKAQTKS